MSNGPCDCFFEEVSKSGDAELKRFQSLTQTTYIVGSYTVALYAECPLTSGHLLSCEEDGHTLDRTGLLLWPGSTAMTHALLKLGDSGVLSHCSVLELGCGVGLCGLIASLYASGPVVLSDQSDETCAAARENVRCNQHLRNTSKAGCVAEVQKLDWLMVGSLLESTMDETDSLCFDLVIASDVLYVEEPRWGGLDPEELRKLFRTIFRKLAPGGIALLSYANREDGAEDIREAARQNGLLCRQLPLGDFMAKGILQAYGASSLAFTIMFSFTAVNGTDTPQFETAKFSSVVNAALAREMPLTSAQSST